MIEAILAVLWFMILVLFLQVLHLHAELRITREAKHRYMALVKQSEDVLKMNAEHRERVSHWAHDAVDLIKAQQRRIEELERQDSADWWKHGGDPNER